jgi:hypothetical protein
VVYKVKLPSLLPLSYLSPPFGYFAEAGSPTITRTSLICGKVFIATTPPPNPP